MYAELSGLDYSTHPALVEIDSTDFGLPDLPMEGWSHFPAPAGEDRRSLIRTTDHNQSNARRPDSAAGG
jgi:hypothetical protein